MGKPRLTTDQWVARARKRWGDRFDYSLVQYIDRSTSVEIICPIHGPIWVSPEYHVRNIEGNTGCTQCGIHNRNSSRRMTFDEFLRRAREIHGDKFAYDESSWPANVFGPIRYTCPEHGPVEQAVYAHLSKRKNNSGCYFCGRRNATHRYRRYLLQAPRRPLGELLSTGGLSDMPHELQQDLAARLEQESLERFIKKATYVHGDAYDYSECIYVKASVPVKIICRKPGHGAFYPHPSAHIHSKSGCPACAGVRKLTRESFIAKARALHGDKYTYDNVTWVNTAVPVHVTCPTHGDWPVLPSNFLHQKPGQFTGSGCPQCSRLLKGVDSLSYFREHRSWADSSCFLYLALVDMFIKPGISRSPAARDPTFYRDIVYQRSESRATVWCVEQKFLTDSANAAPRKIPKHFAAWRGRNELRCVDPTKLELISVLLDDEVDRCLEMGWEAYADEHLIPNIGYGWVHDFSK